MARRPAAALGKSAESISVAFFVWLRKIALSFRTAHQTQLAGNTPLDLKSPESGPSRFWYLLLLLPFFAMFWVGSYNRVEPEWGGIPFFYWYQLVWIAIGAGLTLIVYFATHRQP